MKTHIKTMEVAKSSGHSVKFNTLRDGDYDNLKISDKMNNGDWDYWLVIRTENMDNFLSEEEVKDYGLYNVSLLAVSPKASGKNLKKALESCGLEKTKKDMEKIEALIDYGIFATLYSASGNNLDELQEESLKQADIASMMFGFMMDVPENMIGNDGWDFISGNIGFKTK